MADTASDIKKCNMRALVSGVRPWWKAEAVPGLKDLGCFSLLLISAIAVFALAVHLLYLIGALIAKVAMLDVHFENEAAMSLIAYYNTTDSVAIHSAIGAIPFFLAGALYLWGRKLCAYGQPAG